MEHWLTGRASNDSRQASNLNIASPTVLSTSCIAVESLSSVWMIELSNFSIIWKKHKAMLSFVITVLCKSNANVIRRNKHLANGLLTRAKQRIFPWSKKKPKHEQLIIETLINNYTAKERAFYCFNEQFVSNITGDKFFSIRSSERFGKWLADACEIQTVLFLEVKDN